MISCYCGRQHAPWWGRWVNAPSCTLTESERAFHAFLDFGKRRNI